jgi:hypothetical protein
MAELPQDVVDEVERLTRLARNAVDDGEATAYERERESMLAEYDFTARVREEDDTLVLHPAEWIDDGVIRVDRIEDVDRGIEVSLSGAGDPDDWDAVEAHNADLVDAVAEEAGEIHAANARAFADFMGNHYAKRVERATAEELQEFLDEYYPRNAWPSDEQRAVIAQSLELLFDAAKTEVPEFTAVRR